MNNFGYLSQLANNGTLGVCLVLSLLANIYLFKTLMASKEDLSTEKDKEIQNEKDTIEKVTLVIDSINNTQKALIMDFEKNAIYAKKNKKS